VRPWRLDAGGWWLEAGTPHALFVHPSYQYYLEFSGFSQMHNFK
jgi:hypothetical protein